MALAEMGMILFHHRVGTFFKLIETVRGTTVSIRQIKSIIVDFLFANNRLSCWKSTDRKILFGLA